jgi:hypothetical protein
VESVVHLRKGGGSEGARERERERERDERDERRETRDERRETREAVADRGSGPRAVIALVALVEIA